MLLRSVLRAGAAVARRDERHLTLAHRRRLLATGPAEFPSASTAPAPTGEGRRRVGFRLRLTCKPQLLEQYKQAHAAVWPDMQEALRRSGWHNYSLFLSGDDGVMFGYFEADTTFQDALDRMGQEAINKTWQDAMKRFVPDVDPGDVDGATPLDESMVELEHIMYIGDDKLPTTDATGSDGGGGTAAGGRSAGGARLFSTCSHRRRSSLQRARSTGAGARHMSGTTTAVVGGDAAAFVTEAELQQLSRRELQGRAKAAGVKANATSKAIIQQLLALAPAPASNATPTVASPPPTRQSEPVVPHPEAAATPAAVSACGEDMPRWAARVLAPFLQKQTERHMQLLEQFEN